MSTAWHSAAIAVRTTYSYFRRTFVHRATARSRHRSAQRAAGGASRFPESERPLQNIAPSLTSLQFTPVTNSLSQKVSFEQISLSSKPDPSWHRSSKAIGCPACCSHLPLLFEAWSIHLVDTSVGSYSSPEKTASRDCPQLVQVCGTGSSLSHPFNWGLSLRPPSAVYHQPPPVPLLSPQTSR